MGQSGWRASIVWAPTVLSEHDDGYKVDREEKHGRHDQAMQEEKVAPCPQCKAGEDAEKHDREDQVEYVESREKH
jgi:hypothetical protein